MKRGYGILDLYNVRAQQEWSITLELLERSILRKAMGGMSVSLPNPNDLVVVPCQAAGCDRGPNGGPKPVRMLRSKLDAHIKSGEPIICAGHSGLWRLVRKGSKP